MTLRHHHRQICSSTTQLYVSRHSAQGKILGVFSSNETAKLLNYLNPHLQMLHLHRTFSLQNFLIEKLTLSLHKKKRWISLFFLIWWVKKDSFSKKSPTVLHDWQPMASSALVGQMPLFFCNPSLVFLNIYWSELSWWLGRLLSEGQKRVIKNPGFLCTYPLIYHMGNQYSHGLRTHDG